MGEKRVTTKKLKDIYSAETVGLIAAQVQEIVAKFDTELFQKRVFAEGWEALELKQRYQRLAQSVYDTLALPYSQVVDILVQFGERYEGFKYLFFPEIVSMYGLDSFEDSMRALESLTCSSSAEFAIRPFLQKDFERTFMYMKKWAISTNEHHRRLASEGLRPLLPWGMRVPVVHDHVAEILQLLTSLNEDNSLYVRKSVANHLNDWSKIQPDLVLETLKMWDHTNEHTAWIMKKGLRTLLKEGNEQALALLHYQEVEYSVLRFEVNPTVVHLGESSSIVYDLTLQTASSTVTRLSYAIDFVKANGTTSRKIFFLKEVSVTNNQVVRGAKHYRWQDYTTRTHYAGEHRIALLINGKEVASTVVVLEKQV